LSLTGERGVFATRLAYVTSGSRSADSRVTLRVSDADGYQSADHRRFGRADHVAGLVARWARLAYVSFEKRKPAIFIQELTTGRRERVSSYDGINGSPAFSPDGRKLAMTLSKDGSPDIYVMELASKQLTRLTDHYAIDTEPPGRRMAATSSLPRIGAVAADLSGRGERWSGAAGDLRRRL
jgi:TolB protein